MAVSQQEIYMFMSNQRVLRGGIGENVVAVYVAAAVFVFTSIRPASAQEDGERITVLSEDFEALALPIDWEYKPGEDDSGKIERIDGAVRMTDSVDGGAYTTNEMVVRVNLAGATDVHLSFDQTDLQDEEHVLPVRFQNSVPGDGVSVSSDGVNWVKAYSWDKGQMDTTGSVSISLTEIVRSYKELSFNDDFRIKFQQYDDYTDQYDGRIYDNIKVELKTNMGCGGITLTEDFEITGAADPKIVSLALATNVRGRISIRDTSDIENLSFLSNLQCVGTLDIGKNSALTSLSGLESLHTVRRRLFLGNNPLLTKITPLRSLRNVGGFHIFFGDALQSLEGLEGIHRIGVDGLRLDIARGLSSLKGLDNLAVVHGEVVLNELDALESLEGLNALVEAGGLRLGTHSEKLTSLAPLGSLKRLTGAGLHFIGNRGIDSLGELVSLTDVKVIRISNSVLTNLEGLEDINIEGAGRVTIDDNIALTSLKGLGGVKMLSELRVERNEHLHNLIGLEQLHTVSNSLLARAQAGITINDDTYGFTSLEGLNGLEIVGRFDLNRSENIETLSALGKLHSVDNLQISSRKLRNLDGLQGLVDVGSIEVSNGQLLESVSGLDNLRSVEGLTIRGAGPLVEKFASVGELGGGAIYCSQQ